MQYQVISTDNHINEPPGTYVDRVPAAMRDRAPRIVRGEDGGEGMSAETRQAILSGNAVRAYSLN